MATLDVVLSIARAAGKTENLSSYFYLLRGLDSIPIQVINCIDGGEHIDTATAQVMQIAGPVVSLIACALLLYFHTTSLPRKHDE